MKRDEVLDTAKELINGDRARTYGDHTTLNDRVSAGWSAITGAEITPLHVDLMMVFLKMIRITASPGHADSYADAAGYIALAAELEPDG